MLGAIVAILDAFLFAKAVFFSYNLLQSHFGRYSHRPELHGLDDKYIVE